MDEFQERLQLAGCAMSAQMVEEFVEAWQQRASRDGVLNQSGALNQ